MAYSAWRCAINDCGFGGRRVPAMAAEDSGGLRTEAGDHSGSTAAYRRGCASSRNVRGADRFCRDGEFHSFLVERRG